MQTEHSPFIGNRGNGAFGARACLLAALWGTASAMAAPALLPQPRSAELGNPALTLTGSFDIHWSNCRNDLLDRAAARFAADVNQGVGLAMAAGKPVALRIDCRKSGPEPQSDVGEAYRLRVDSQQIDLAAEGPTGVLRGLATLRQLSARTGEGFALYAATIDDAPRFAWRGLMIDTARHFIALPTLKRQIDAMERVKLNALHLHLSDNEGFRVESKLYPKLTAVSSQGQYYTQAEIRELVAYAADRGIRIVPEFDVPGHARAILMAYPEFGVAAKLPAALATPAQGVALALDPSSEKTYAFLGRLFGEMSTLFPDRHFHVGGDEVARDAWQDPAIEAFMKKHGLASKTDLESYFHKRVHAILRGLGKTMIGWDEVAHGSVPADVVVQVWRSSKQSAHATARGHRVIVSAGYYLDFLLEAEKHYAVDPLDPTAHGTTPEQLEALQKDPVVASFITDATVIDPSVRLDPQAEALIIGGEAPLWTELVTDEMLDGRLWPRAAAIAERFWSPAQVRDPADMYRRLAIVQDQLRVLGLEDAANQQRMIARLAPGETQPVQNLVDVLRTARHAELLRVFGVMMQGKPVPPLTFGNLADAASTDSPVARRFTLDVDAYLKGDHALAAGLRARLVGWRENHVRFAEVARGRPRLEAALPVSADVAALAEAGLAAITAIEARQKLHPDAERRAELVLERQAAAANVAGAGILGLVARTEPPPEYLLIALAPGIGELVEAASASN